MTGVALDNPFWAWRPSAAAFGQFVHAAGERYSGAYVAPGQTTPLPRVNFWAAGNEPNFGEDLGPQAVDGSTVSVAPGMYRLLDATWNALQSDGARPRHVPDRRVRARGPERRRRALPSPGPPGDFSQTKPLQFLRTLYCVASTTGVARARAPVGRVPGHGRRLAELPGRQNPALFNATGVADHPYSFTGSPRCRASTDPDIATVPAASRISSTRSTGSSASTARASGSRSTTPSTATSPTPRTAFVPLAGDRRVLHQLGRVPELEAAAGRHDDAVPPVRPDTDRRDRQWRRRLRKRPGAVNGKAKPGYAAYRLPLLLPVTSTRRGRSLEVWGCVRPARYAIPGGGQPQRLRSNSRLTVRRARRLRRSAR